MGSGEQGYIVVKIHYFQRCSLVNLTRRYSRILNSSSTCEHGALSKRVNKGFFSLQKTTTAQPFSFPPAKSSTHPHLSKNLVQEAIERVRLWLLHKITMILLNLRYS